MHFFPKNDILKSEKSPRKEAAMPTLTDPAVIKELLQRHGFSFSRALGQNFIINPGVCPKMAELDEAASLNLSPASPASRPIRKSKTFTAG